MLSAWLSLSTLLGCSKLSFSPQTSLLSGAVLGTEILMRRRNSSLSEKQNWLRRRNKQERSRGLWAMKQPDHLLESMQSLLMCQNQMDTKQQAQGLPVSFSSRKGRKQRQCLGRWPEQHSVNGRSAERNRKDTETIPACLHVIDVDRTTSPPFCCAPRF